MISAILIVMLAALGFAYGDQFLLAPQWIRLTVTVVVGLVLFMTVAIDRRRD